MARTPSSLFSGGVCTSILWWAASSTALCDPRCPARQVKAVKREWPEPRTRSRIVAGRRERQRNVQKCSDSVTWEVKGRNLKGIRAKRLIHLPSKCNYGRFYAVQQEFSFSLQTLFLLLSLNPKKVTILFNQRKSLPGPLCKCPQGRKLGTEKMSIKLQVDWGKKILTKIKVKVSILEL